MSRTKEDLETDWQGEDEDAEPTRSDNEIRGDG